MHTAVREGSFDAAFVIDIIYAKATFRPCPAVLVLVLDNARIHHSATFQAHLPHWEDQDIHLFYLPTYIPHLSKIETRWRQTKCEWLRPETFTDSQTFETVVWHILYHVGEQFTVKFAT